MPSRASTIQADPNIVPMIDILLVLLIIFMMFSVIGVPHLPLQVPDPAATAAPGVPLVLSVDAGPTYSLNGRVLERARLQQELVAVFAGRPEKVLFVRGAREVRYQEVVAAFDAARGAGVRATGVVVPPQ